MRPLIILIFTSCYCAVQAQSCFDPDSCWPHVITSDNHTIIMSEAPALNGDPLPAGSYIGVFFDAGSGVLKCAGKQQWNGSPTSLAAFGNDGSAPPVGFADGESFQFKYLLPTGEIVDLVFASFVSPPGQAGILTHTGSFASQGLSQVDSMNGELALNISGIIATENGTPVPACTVHLTGSQTDSMVTGSDGYYSFDVMKGGSYTVTPSKANDSVVSNGISTLDILLIQKQILAIQNLGSPHKIIAADVNNSSTVTTLDIVFIRSVILASSNSFPGNKLWKFVSSDQVFPDPVQPFPFTQSRSYNNLSQSYAGQDFIGVKLGDVNGSWDAGTP